MQKLLRPWADALWDTGIEFGTVGVGKDGDRLEITTFRADTYDQVSRNPEVRFGDRLEDDLVRRDFTVNAMAVRITADGPGEFLDPLGGLAALRARVLDTPVGAGGVVRRRSAADAAGGAVRLAARLHRRAAGAGGDARRWRRSWAGSPPSGSPPNWTSCCSAADPVAGHRPDGADRPRRCGAARGRRDADGHRRAPSAQGRLLAFADGAAAGDRPGGRRTRSGAAVGGAAARHRQARHPQARARRRGELSSPRGGGRQDGRASGCGR